MKTLISLVLLVSSVAFADATTFVFRSVEDATTPPDDTICAAAPFRVNVKLGASLWSQVTRLVDGRVVVEKAVRIGRATACVQLTNFLFPPGLSQNFYAVFDLPLGRFVANGTCTLTSNNVPEAGLVLAGCALTLVSGPAGVQGGVLTSASTFNPARLQGYSTGSVWTLQTYTADRLPWWPSGPGWSWHDDRRSDDDVRRAADAVGGER
ncbi:MAG: hypothetical protein U0228_24040 [Myxococcaceae bacterium]